MPNEEIATIREHRERFRAMTLQALERTPSDKLHGSPSPGLMTFAGQYAQLASVERLDKRPFAAPSTSGTQK